MVKNPLANAGDIKDKGSVPGWERSPGGGHGDPTPGFLPGKSYGQRILVGYVHRVCKESDMTERLEVGCDNNLKTGLGFGMSKYLHHGDYDTPERTTNDSYGVGNCLSHCFLLSFGRKTTYEWELS